MIFLLNIVLVVNLLLAYKYFKNIIAPPVLMGVGMLTASFIATLYYYEWELCKFCFSSVFILGGGTLFFTMCCILFSKFGVSYKLKHSFPVSLSFINKSHFIVWYSILLPINFFYIVFSLYYLRSHFGSLGIQELIFARRLDILDSGGSFSLPPIVRQMGTLSSIGGFISMWLLSLIMVSSTKVDTIIKWLVIIHIILQAISGFLTGSKSPFMDMVIHIAIFFLFSYYSSIGSFRLPKSLLYKGLISFVVLAFSFKGISLLIGRDVEDQAGFDLLAEYCGAEIKNFDMYIAMHPNGSGIQHKWGGYTFITLYRELFPNSIEFDYEYQQVNGHLLGNVYTQFRPFYEDFGIIGVFVMVFIIALISMFFYKKASVMLIIPTRISVGGFIYSSMALAIFMSFFSNRFGEIVLSLSWIRSSIYIWLFSWLFNRFVVKH